MQTMFSRAIAAVLRLFGKKKAGPYDTVMQETLMQDTEFAATQFPQEGDEKPPGRM